MYGGYVPAYCLDVDGRPSLMSGWYLESELVRDDIIHNEIYDNCLIVDEL